MHNSLKKRGALRQFTLAVGIGFLCAESSVGATFTWTGAGTDNNWSTAANWAGNAAPANDGTSVILLAGTNRLSPAVNVPWDINTLNFSNNAGAFVLGGSALTIRAGGIVSSNASLETVGNDLTLAANQTWNAAAGNLAVAGNVNNGTNLLTVTGTFNTLLSGILGGSGGLAKTGSGTATLGGANTYSGVTTVSAGILSIQNSAALGSATGGTVVASGAVLQLQGGISITSEALTISGSGLLSGGALRSVTGDNTWSGIITLVAAASIGCDANSLTIGTGGIINSTFLATITNAGTITLAGPLGSGSGGLTKTGVGTLVVNGTNTFTGVTTISGGVVQFGATGSLPPTSAVTVNSGATLDLNNFNETIASLAGAGNVTLGSGNLTLGNSSATTFSGVISGTGSLFKVGTATLTLSGINTWSGGATISAGSISIKADNNLGDTNGVLTLNGGTLTTSVTLTAVRPVTLGVNGGTVNPGGTTLTLSGNISGPGALTKIGTKTLSLTGTNTYLGGTTNSAGTITINSDSRLGDSNGPITFSASATLTTTASFTSLRNIYLAAGIATYTAGTGFTNTLNGVISGAGALTKKGSGVLLLGGINTYTNTTTISAGTLRLGGNERLSDLTPVTISTTSGILDLNSFTETIGSIASTAAGKITLGSGTLIAGSNNTSTTLSAVISGTGSFTKIGTGTLTNSGANTYTGTTTISGGTLQISTSERIANTSPVVVNSGGILNLNNFSETIGSLAGAGSVTLGSGTLTAGNSSTATFSGAISGTGAFVKVGFGTAILSGANSYSGATTINLGNVQVNGSLSNSAVTVASSAAISGTGTVTTVAINSGGTNSPGASGPGTLASGAQTWAGLGNYLWKINNATGSRGADPGWSWLNIAGSLTINATAGSKFVIRITSLSLADAAGPAANFDNTATYVWTIASASGGIVGFDVSKFTLDTSAFQNSLGAGAFSLTQNGNDLNLIFTSAAQASIKAVQSGTFTSAGIGTNTVSITAVNPTNAFLIFNARHNSSVPGGSMVRGRLSASNSVEFARVTAETSTINVQWYVIEYSAGVRVQRGEVSQTNTTLNVPLTVVSSTNQAFVTWSKTPELAAALFDNSQPVLAELTSATNLQVRVGAYNNLLTPPACPVISWQVIEFLHPTSINVQKGSVSTMTGTNTSATATLATAVDTNSTFILAGYRTAGSGINIGARMVRAQLTDASTVSFDRSISGGPDDITEIAWQAVQLKDGSSVQRGTLNFPSGQSQTNAVLTSLNTNRAAAFSAAQPGGGQSLGRSPSTGTALGVGAATMTLTSGSQVTLARNNTSDAADLGWFVVGFGPGSMLVPATGGSSISADTQGGAYTALTGPTYTEIQSGNVGVGTIILNAPAGFVVDPGGTAPTVLITRIGGTGADALNVNGVASGSAVAMTGITTSNLTFTVTSVSSGGVTCSLFWQNVRVRPSAGTPLAVGNMTSAGTSVLQGVTTNSTTFGFLAEVVGAATQLAFQTTASTTATAGVEFTQQPVLQVQDQFGNLRAADNATTVNVAINTGSGVLQGPATVTVVNGVAGFSGLSYLVAETVTLKFTASGLSPKNSGNIVVSPAAASQLTVQTQPSAAPIAGVAFPQQPVVRVEDQFGNLRATDSSTVVTASLNQGSGTLLGTLNATAVNGLAAFSNLKYQVAETITIDFTSGSLDPDTSASVNVNPAAASQLVFLTQPGSATVGSVFGVQPLVIIQDNFGNNSLSGVASSLNVTMAIASGAGTLQGTTNVDAGTSSGNGSASFSNLRIDSAGSKQLTASAAGLSSATSASFTVGQGSQTVTFGALPGKTYGDAAITLSASASSGLPVAFSLVSGPASLSSNVLSLTGVGTVVVRASQAGNADYTVAANVDQSFTVAKAALTVTADNKTRVFGAANPTLTVSCTNFVNGDTAGVLTGLPALTTAATNTSTVAGSPYSIVLTAGTLASSNYSFTFVNGQLSVTPASTAGAVSTSANPSPTGSNVTFTASLTAVSPGAGTPSGTVQFLADGSVLGSPATLVGGSAAVTTSSLPHGTHVMTARYAGDGNFFGSTNTLAPNQVINSAPAAANDSLQRYPLSGVKVRSTTLLANDSDPENDLLTLSSAGPSSAAGSSVVSKNFWLLYTPPSGFTNADSFPYTISDTGGLRSTGSVSITIVADLTISQNLLSTTALGGGSARIQFLGIAGRAYTIQFTTNLVSPAWQFLAAATADATGRFEITDSTATGRFYRTTYP
jgi:autotransporter-associated beta strand protein